MSIRCRLGWHDRGVSSHRLGQPTTFYMHCRRCGKHWTDTFWLPPQPINCHHGDEYRIELRSPEMVGYHDGEPQYRRWFDCRICRNTRNLVGP